MSSQHIAVLRHQTKGGCDEKMVVSSCFVILFFERGREREREREREGEGERERQRQRQTPKEKK